ncbi:26S proteasome subunit RPN7-domain-containing protein [Peziza echinospora]|nr:26S proteasome subunit RPN7-domain-containing protein [Peziza echinospora]
MEGLPQNHWAAKEAKGEIIVTEPPKFDLEGYIANYTGRTQVDRLLLIGDTCRPLAVEALKLAISILKKSSDVTRYKAAVATLYSIDPTDADARLDEEWVDKVSKRVANDLEKFDAQLKSYKHNLIKESIRMGHEDLGNHYYNSGDLSNAFKSYSRMRDFCTAPKHILDMSLQIIKVCIEQGNYMSLQSYVMKIRNLTRNPEEEELLKPKLATATGLLHLSGGNFRDAARSFLECPNTLGNTWNDVISSNDVAIYGGLCALASMDRSTLKSKVLDNSEFRNFLELEPHIRRAITYFYTAKYNACLSILQAYKNDYLLDIHLHKHVEDIYELVRSKSIVQYFVPFSTVRLSAMSEAFGTREADLERELVGMIEAGKLQARIDTQNRVVTSKETNLRNSVHQDTLQMAQHFERSARLKLMKVQISRAGLDIKAPKIPRSDSAGRGVFVGGTSQIPSGSIFYENR